MHVTSLGRLMLVVGLSAATASTAGAAPYVCELASHPGGAPAEAGYEGRLDEPHAEPALGALGALGDRVTLGGEETGNRLLVAASPGGARPIPEPASVALIGLGLAGLAVHARRRMR